MVMVKEFVTYDFSIKRTTETWYIYLSKNLIVTHYKKDSDNPERVTNTSQEPIITSDRFGLMIWDVEEGAWCQVCDEIREAYVSYVAEKEILGS
jgi:hypothetical protein